VFFIFRVIGRFLRIKHGPALFVPAVGKNAFLFAVPFPVFIKAADGKQDMRVRIAVPFIMQCPVRDHAPGCEVLPDIVSDAFYLLFAAHLDRECDLDFPGELCIRPLFRFLDFVPQGLPVAVFFRGAVRENDLTHNDSGFMSEIMNKSGLFIDQFLTGTIRCGSNGRPAAAPADDFNGAMIDRHSRSPPSSPRRAGSGAASRRTNGAERNGITWAPPMYKCALTA